MAFFLKTTLNSGGFVDVAAQVSSERTFYYLISFLKWKRRNEMEDRGGVMGREGERREPAASSNVIKPSRYNTVINCWHSWGSRHKLILTHLQTANILQWTLCNYISKMKIKWHLKPGCHAQWSGHVEKDDCGDEEHCGVAACYSGTAGPLVTRTTCLLPDRQPFVVPFVL